MTLKFFTRVGLTSVLLIAGTVSAQELTTEQQEQIVKRFMYVTGQLPATSPLLSEADSNITRPEKCGTPAILDYYQNLNSIDRRTRMALGVQDVPRPVTQAEYGLPGGNTLIHYDLTGAHAVWQANIDVDADGVPDYVEALAAIADSCYHHLIDTLDFRMPLDDSGCLNGGDSRVDIYVQALPFGFYGMTHNQSECYEPTVQTEASWVLIDHDFQHLPDYQNNAIDAARVTIAHELFHTIHFAIDATEHPSWFEMSAVWMEEEIYDEINDYYLFDFVFYDFPRVSLADTVIPGHMYQAAVFPIYLTEKYDRGVIKAVWDRAGAMGLGPHFIEAFDHVIDSTSAVPENADYRCNCLGPDGVTCLDSSIVPANFASALTEFAVWNYFTGQYAPYAPEGVGFSERENYSEIPLEAMESRSSYPFRVTVLQNQFKPQPNGASYVRFENLDAIVSDTLLTAYVAPSDEPIVRWGVAGILELESPADSHLVFWDVVDDWETPNCRSGWECVRWNDDNTVCIDSTCADLGVPFRLRYINELVGEWLCLTGEFGNDVLCDPTCSDSTRILNTNNIKALTLVMVPSALSTGPYIFGDYIGFAYVSNDTSSISQDLVNRSPSILLPYPNPAVVAEMGDDLLTFRFQVPTDSTAYPVTEDALLQIDIFNVAGELVRSLAQQPPDPGRSGPNLGGVYEMGWNMRNAGGKEVASGVYLAVARLYSDPSGSDLLAEERVKVAVIR